MNAIDALRYPVGHYYAPATITDRHIAEWIETLDGFPARLRTLITPLTEDQLDTPYRPGGWTVRQLVHHVVDSHVNSYVRFKWAMTEDNPVIKTYDQDFWANEADSRTAPVMLSLDLLAALHARWIYYLSHREILAEHSIIRRWGKISDWTGCSGCTPGTATITMHMQRGWCNAKDGS